MQNDAVVCSDSGSTTDQFTHTVNLLTKEENQVNSESRNSYCLYAGKGWISHKFDFGKLTLGSEASYTNNSGI